jgi:hypothetical protein
MQLKVDKSDIPRIKDFFKFFFIGWKKDSSMKLQPISDGGDGVI